MTVIFKNHESLKNKIKKIYNNEKIKIQNIYILL